MTYEQAKTLRAKLEADMGEARRRQRRAEALGKFERARGYGLDAIRLGRRIADAQAVIDRATT